MKVDVIERANQVLSFDLTILLVSCWGENLQIYKHKTQNELIPEQIQNKTQFSKHSTSKIHKILKHTPKSVSYTHLDVYKRQPINRGRVAKNVRKQNCETNLERGIKLQGILTAI